MDLKKGDTCPQLFLLKECQGQKLKHERKGEAHHEEAAMAEDQDRTFFGPRMLCLMNQSNCDSYIVLRFWESDIKKDLQKCVDTICKYCGR